MSTVGISQHVEDLLPAIRHRREDVETARRLPRDLVQGLRDTGMFALGVPRALGGAEATPMDLMHAIETVAAADGSTGWCAMVGIANNVSAGYMPEEGAREVFADPTLPTAGIAAPGGRAVRVDGGVRVSGRWAFASGVTHCDWAWAGCLVMDDGQPRMTPRGPEIVHACMPVKDLTVHDTWFVSGLCGTGSHDVSVDDLFVPERRTFRLLDPAGHRREPLYRVPPLALFVSQLACVSLGVARGALDELAELAQSKVPSLYTTVLAEQPVSHVEIARAEAALGGARAFLHEIVGEIWDAVLADRAPTDRQLALGRVAATHAVETGAAVTRTANALAGGSSLYSTSALQRHTRDAEAVTHHFTVAPHTWAEAGRVLLGRAPTIAVF
jgi:alkylation response protein AidB-like acyl-CoA dehydrogenase